jgi:hypothetical protein
MSEPLLIRIHCKSVHGDALIFEGRVKRMKSPRGVFDLIVDDIQTPMGLPLELSALYDASCDNGNLTISTSGRCLLGMSPLTRRSCCNVILPTDEELTMSAQ